MTVLIIISALIIHPIRMIKCLYHSGRYEHTYNIDTINFRYDIWCDDCGEVFCDEV